MKRLFITMIIVAFATVYSKAQENGFAFGKVTLADLSMKKYTLDSAAEAVVLDEFGETYMDLSDDQATIYEYHIKIKILTADGLGRGTVKVPLYMSSSKQEFVRGLEASTFNLVKGAIVETKLQREGVFSENYNQNYRLYEFTLPQVNVGSVIEYQYRIVSPYLSYAPRPWDFQTEIPKVRSEFWPKFPGYYDYQMSLRGPLSLTSQSDEIIDNCVSGANCIRYKFLMKNIPAFKSEEFMTAEENYRSALYFQLKEVRHSNGYVDHITKEWKDVVQELDQHPSFGVQLRKGKDVLDDNIDALIVSNTDSLAKAKAIYDYVKQLYSWNGVHSIYTATTLRKAFEARKGSIGDINLSLIAALRYAGFRVDPLILSTRDNGFVTDVFPVLTDFNYVVAKLDLNSKTYLLDASNDYLPFGMIPMKCLNGRGRVLHGKESSWYDVLPTDKQKQIIVANVVLESDGHLRGTIQKSYYGYDALKERVEIDKHILSGQQGSDQQVAEKGYLEHLNKKSKNIILTDIQINKKDELDQPLVVLCKVDIAAFDDMSASYFLLNPFIDRVEENPFKAAERLYPIDYGAPVETTYLMTITLPSGLYLESAPEKVGAALPSDGGRYIYAVSAQDNKISLNSSLKINKNIYAAPYYHYLKELYAQMIQAQNTDLVIKRK